MKIKLNATARLTAAEKKPSAKDAKIKDLEAKIAKVEALHKELGLDAPSSLNRSIMEMQDKLKKLQGK